MAIIICVCIAFTVSVSAFAASSPEGKVIIKKGVGTKQDGGSVPVDTFVEVADNNTITVVADEQKYGKFDKWVIYVANADGTYTEAVAGVDYTVTSGSTTDKTMVIVPISRLAIAGNYANTATDPAKPSDTNSNVIMRKGFATREDGTEITDDAFVDVPVGSTLTIKADTKTYGTFNSWSIYTVEDATGTTASGGASVLNLAVTQKTAKAVAGTDYSIVSGSLKSKTAKVKILSGKKFAICGNYGGKITDPLSASSVAGTKTDKSAKTNDLNVMYAVMVLLAAGAVVFGAKRQLSK
jgi:3-polyprenyl-4-hydroxybenzoate decarboxylase